MLGRIAGLPLPEGKGAAHPIGLQRGKGRERKGVGDIGRRSDNPGLWDLQEKVKKCFLLSVEAPNI
jgi:hypothetical protein